MIVDFSLRAERQIDKARRWWLGNRDKAPEVFDEEIDRAYDLILRASHAAPWVRIRRGRARRLTLERIRYYLYYRVHPDRVEVIFFWHTSRRPPRL